MAYHGNEYWRNIDLNEEAENRGQYLACSKGGRPTAP
jgi:hypothetical protein